MEVGTSGSGQALRGTAAAAVVVAALAAGLYAQTAGHEFTWDDGYNVVENAGIRDLANIPRFFTEPWGAGAADAMSRGINTNYYRPVALTSYALDHALFGLSPAAFHGTNVLLHVLVSLLVLWLGLRLFPSRRDRLGVALGAALFAAHPVHTEAVDVITYRTDLLAALFTVAALVVWLPGGRGRGAGAERRVVWLWAPLLYALGLGAKEMAAPLPLLLALLDLWAPPRPLRLWQRAWRLVPVAAVLLGYLALRATLLEPSAYSYFGDAPGGVIALTMLGVFGLYVRLLVLPWPLNPFYDWSVVPLESSLLAARPLLGLALLAAWVGAVAVAARSRPRLAFCLASLVVLLLPVSQVLPVVVAAGERFLYLASAGPLLAAGLGVAWLARRALPVRRAVWTCAALVLLVGSALTVARNLDWRTDRTILEAYVRDWPESYNAWYGLATLEEREGRLDQAIVIHERLGRAEDAARLRGKAARMLQRPGAGGTR